ncbi:hypothetical protein, partial [Klebsiella pneumoniae]|uniref:hypothetical protein n=1 Tax=Klebsiella pneumoniae TaxID=573 RepID=UPI001D0E4D46
IRKYIAHKFSLQLWKISGLYTAFEVTKGSVALSILNISPHSDSISILLYVVVLMIAVFFYYY